MDTNCPRCDSHNTKFCYFIDYDHLQPRHFCKTCRRYWTKRKSIIPYSSSNKRPALSFNPKSYPIFNIDNNNNKSQLSGGFDKNDLNNTGVFQNLHQGYPTEAMMRFLNALDGNISKSYRKLDTLNWSIQNDIDEISSKLEISEEFYMPGMLGYIKNGQPVITVDVGLSTYGKASVPTVERIDRTFRNFKSGKESWLLQFWAYLRNNSEDIGCILMLTDQTLMSTRDEGLEEYRRRCLENRYRFVGLGTSVGNWFAGRAAQTGIADHRTKQHVTNQQDQHSADVGGKGQLVLPVFYGQGAGNKFLGIIELVTSVPKGSYVEDFEQLQNLLTDEGLKSSYMGKTIKFKYDDDLIKFTLPLSAEFADLHREVKTRFPELEQKFRVEYDDTEGNRLPISSDEDLRVCMAESSLKGGRFISMRVQNT